MGFVITIIIVAIIFGSFGFLFGAFLTSGKMSDLYAIISEQKERLDFYEKPNGNIDLTSKEVKENDIDNTNHTIWGF